MFEIRTKHVYEDLSKDKEIFHFRIFCIKFKYYDYSNKLVAGKMKDELSGVTIK